MPLDQRPYMANGSPHGAGRTWGPGLGLPRPSRVVGVLLVINLAAFVVQVLGAFATKPGGTALADLLGVTVGAWWQVWRYLTFQFLHDTGNLWHLALNMLALYMLGGPLERLWGGRRFLVFYLLCGVAAGVAYVIIGLFAHLHPTVPIVGASGGVYGILLAAAVLLPHMRLILLFFLVPIRLVAVIVFVGMVLTVLSSLSEGHAAAAMSDVAHLGGAVAAAIWLWVFPQVRSAGRSLDLRLRRGAWDRAMKRRAAEQDEIDRILQKIHDRGLQTLSGKERRTLQQASRRERQRDRQIERL